MSNHIYFSIIMRIIVMNNLRKNKIILIFTDNFKRMHVVTRKTFTIFETTKIEEKCQQKKFMDLSSCRREKLDAQ